MQKNQQLYLHPQQPVLQSQHSDITNTNFANLLKIDYLTKQKQILETQIQQLELNNKLMRKINANIVHGQQINLQELVARNEQVQGMIRNVVEENRVLRTENFLAVQVNLDNQKQFRNILHNYQQKILQLRKSIQIKQSNIQSLEENHFLGAYWGTLDQKKISILFDYQQLKAQILQNRLKNMEYLKQIEKLNKEIKEYKEKISRLQLIMMAKPCYKEYLSGTDQIRAKSLPRILIPKLKNLEEKQKKSENFINCSNLCQTRPSFNKNANSTVFLGDINLLTYDERRKLIQLKKIAHGKTIENQKLSNQIKTMKDSISALKAENKKLMQSNSIYQKSRRKVTEQSNRWQLLSNIFYNFLTQRRIIQHEAKDENLIQDDISFLKPKIKTSSKILQKKQKTNHHIKNQQWKQIKKELDKRILSISISTTRKRSYSCILDYIAIPIEIKSKKEQINAEDEQFSLYLDNSGFIGKSVKNGTYQKQVQFSNLNQFEESGIFSDVLRNI